VSAYPAADLKRFLREEVLRDDFGRPYPPQKRLRVLALYIEGTMEGMPPLRHWECPAEGGWNEDGADGGEALDVDGLVGKIQVLVDREILSSKKTTIFRLCAIMGMDVSISPSSIGPSYPFTIKPSRRIQALDTDDASPFAQSVGEANQRGFDSLGMAAMRVSSEILFPQLQQVAENNRDTINELRAMLADERAENEGLRTRLRQAEDSQLERTLKVREHAFNQRLKERGAKMVISTATMVVSAWLAKQKGDDGSQNRQMGPGGGGGGGGGGGHFRALPPEPVAPQMNGNGAQANGAQADAAPHKHCGTCTCTPEQLAAEQQARQAQQAQQAAQGPSPEDRDHQILMRATRKDFDIDGLFNIFVAEIHDYAIELVQAFPVESQGLLFQAYEELKNTGKVGPILLAGICDNFSTNEQVAAIMQKIRSEKGRVAFAAILHDHWLKREREKEEGREFVSDLDTRSDRMSSGEIVGAEPQIPVNPEEEIEVNAPRFLTRKEASEHRQKQQLTRGGGTTQKVDVVVNKPRKEQPL